MDTLTANLQKALDFRLNSLTSFFEEPHQSAFRLFHGFSEGLPELVVDVYGKTLVISPLTEKNTFPNEQLIIVNNFYLEQLKWVKCSLIKHRSRSGNSVILFGENPDSKVLENGIWYAIDLLKHQDSTFYLDTRNLRDWISKNVRGKTVLNTFAYTGSLGGASYGGAAKLVIQTDLNQSFLNLAKKTCLLNGFASQDQQFITGDFFSVTAEFKRKGLLFDCVILDPPYFSKTAKGSFNLNKDFKRLANKVRPMVAHDGILICVNNALYVPGNMFLEEIEAICSDGYAKIEEIINCPVDVVGMSQDQQAHLPADPSPFNHPTKIVAIRITRKDQLPSNL